MADGSNALAHERLRQIVERIERLEEEKAAIAQDIREVKAEAKGAGFDVKIINQMLRERKLTAGERREFAALCELYRAALGMLDGTPLGEAARKRLSPPADPEEPEGEEGGEPQGEATPRGELAPQDLAEARARGHAAATAGAKILDNPYVAGDPRRAAWDEGWCAETGSDGMDIPDAWRRKKKPKPGAEGQPEGNA